MTTPWVGILTRHNPDALCPEGNRR